MSGIYPVVGCQGSTGVFPRLEIHDLSTYPYMWSLFIRAFSNLQKDDYRPVAASFREIAFIHGFPAQLWKGDPAGLVGGEDSPSPQWEGYCPHGTPMFPTWHRVYMMLIEQAIFMEAKSIAEAEIAWLEKKDPKDDEVDNWRVAADRLRFPFWDWTNERVAKDGIPAIFREEKISIYTNKSGKEWYNPLTHYAIGNTPADFVDDDNGPTDYGYFKSWQRSYRWPTQDKEFPQEQYEKLNEDLQHDDTPASGYSSVAQLATKVGRTFLYPTTTIRDNYEIFWDRFSNTNVQSLNTMKGFAALYFTLEDPHNMVHDDVGGYGHMADITYAGLDPIFFLHHCNIDRFYAYWEYVYPNYWINKGYFDEQTQKRKDFVDPHGNYAEVQDIVVDEDFALAPFRRRDGAYWASKDVRFLHEEAPVSKYYTYPKLDLPGKPGLTLDVSKVPDPSQAAALAQGMLAYFKVSGVPPQGLPKLQAPFFKTGKPEPSLPETHKILDDHRLFIIVAALDKQAFNRSYKLQLFAKDKPNVILGTIAVFARKDPSRCAACIGRDTAGLKVKGSIIVEPEAMVALPGAADVVHRENAADEEVLGVIRGSFGARLVTSGADPIAETDIGSNSGGLGASLPEAVLPLLTLTSAAVAIPKEGDDGHHFLTDWKDHGALVHGGWKRRAS